MKQIVGADIIAIKKKMEGGFAALSKRCALEIICYIDTG